MTYGCDTSFLMRILTNHPKPLSLKVIETAYKRVLEGCVFEISDTTLSEAYYALQASYGVSKADALLLLRKISVAKGFAVSEQPMIFTIIPSRTNTHAKISSLALKWLKSALMPI